MFDLNVIPAESVTLYYGATVTLVGLPPGIEDNSARTDDYEVVWDLIGSFQQVNRRSLFGIIEASFGREIVGAGFGAWVVVVDGVEYGAQIKLAYEAEPDTNAFDDAARDKLILIENNADVTDNANVDAAGAVMEADTSTAGMGFVIDEDTMVSNSPTKVPTQQSVKQYVDANNTSNVIHKGSYDAATNTPDLDVAPAGDIVVGWMYTVTVAGVFFTANVEVGDVLICNVDAPTLETDWTIVNKNLDSASVKVLYELNADTNAFTDAEKTRLGATGVITTGSGVPGSTPSAEGDTYVDTTNDNIYVAAGTASSADWKQVDASSGLPASNVSIELGTGSPTVDDVQGYINNTGSSGFFDGGDISDAGAGAILIALGAGFIRDTASSIAVLKSFKWAASGSLAVALDTTQYVYVDKDGVFTLSPDEFLETEANIQIGYATNEGGVIVNFGKLGVRLDDGIGQAGRFMRRAHGITRDNRHGGLTLAEKVTRNITLSTGHLWFGRTDNTIPAIDTSVADSFLTYSAAGQEAAAATQWPNTQYDNGGVLTTMSNNKWAVLWFYIELNGTLLMAYGRNEYTSEAIANMEGAPASSLPTRISDTAVLAGRLTFQKSAATAASFTSAFDVSFASAGVVSHASLTNLEADDHTQYALRTTGAGAPATTPSREGLIYIDTTADDVYVSVGIASSSDWLKVNSIGGGGSGFTLATPQNTTSGDFFDFTGIPAGVSMIVVMFNEIEHTQSTNIEIAIGDAGGLETSGYESTSHEIVNVSADVDSATDAFCVFFEASNFEASGSMILCHLGNNLWVSSHAVKLNITTTAAGGGRKALTGELDRLRLQADTTSGNFNAGSVNIMYL